jgi:pimeloyl-ACP methyl ester carboxylesterase
LYRVQVNPDGKLGGIDLITAEDLVTGDVIFTNGVKNGFTEAIANGTTHLKSINLLDSSYVLNFNPTQGVFSDLGESFIDIFGAHTGSSHSALAKDLARVINVASGNGVSALHLVGHSQGGAITASALRYASRSGLNLSGLAGGGVSLHGAPVNAYYARTSLARRSGVQVISRAQFGDAVHVFGGLNISNPLEIPVAILRAPALISSDAVLSPHSIPCLGGRAAVCTR